jgi:DHA1 family inner membrane transport protein
VLAVVGLTCLVFAAVYSAMTYIVPFLQTVTGITGGAISVFLLAYGLAAAVGSFSGGRFADSNAARTLVIATVAVAVCLLGLYIVGEYAILVSVALLGLGGATMGMAPSLQHRVVSLAGPGGTLAQSLPASAANVGIAVGSIAGGVAVDAFSASAAVLTGLTLAGIAIPVAWAASFLRPPSAAQGPRSAAADDSADELSWEG